MMLPNTYEDQFTLSPKGYGLGLKGLGLGLGLDNDKVFDKLLVVDNLLLDHVGLPCVLDLNVYLVHLYTWVGRGGSF